MPKGKINLANRLTDNFDLIEKPDEKKIREEILRCLRLGYTVTSIRSELQSAKSIAFDLADSGQKIKTRQRLTVIFEMALNNARDALRNEAA